MNDQNIDVSLSIGRLGGYDKTKVLLLEEFDIRKLSRKNAVISIYERNEQLYVKISYGSAIEEMLSKEGIAFTNDVDL